jgi:hypothetical protein
MDASAAQRHDVAVPLTLLLEDKIALVRRLKWRNDKNRAT